MPDKNSRKINNQEIITDFGKRKILSQNFSRLVAIPKIALLNCNLQEASFVNVKLVQENDEKYIKLTPIQNSELEI